MRGWKFISHDGATAGYRSSLEHFPELGLTIAWLSNTAEFDQGVGVASAVRNLLVKDKGAGSRSVPTPFLVSNEKLNSYVGLYRDDRTAGSVRLFIRDGKLANSLGGNLIPVADNVFLLGQNKLEIWPGKPGQLHLITPVDTVHFTAVDSARKDEKAMAEYVGEYNSEEAETTFYVRVKDGALVAHRPPKTDYILSPLYKDGFNTPAGVIYFERDRKNRISSMKIFVGRARNVEFKKRT